MERVMFSKIHEMNEMNQREKEFYSKLQVAGSIKFVVCEKKWQVHWSDKAEADGEWDIFS
jgi:hypothetical protein